MIDYIKALRIALRAHRGQRDKAGRAYILHPIHVALGVRGKSERIVALLHDVLEDSDMTIEDLGFLNEEEKEALLLLTHPKNEPYFDYINWVKENKIARAVKMSDLKHNSDASRLKEITEKDRQRFAKYQKARAILGEGSELHEKGAIGKTY